MAGNSNRLFIPALGSLYEKLDPYALPILRVATGLILIPHGCQKFSAGSTVWDLTDLPKSSETSATSRAVLDCSR